ncbi:MAG TPA: hypothetical protein VIQ23_11290, partial [Hanamia sp.]
MKIRNLKTWWIILFASLCDFTTSAQHNSGILQQYLLENLENNNSGVNYKKGIQEFYGRIHNQTAWIQRKDTENLKCLLDNLSSAANWGLSEKDYQYSFISAFKNSAFRLQNQADSLKAEINFTDAAIHFYSDIAYGNTTPSLGYAGIKYNPDCHNIPTTLAEYVLNNKIHFLASFVSPTMTEIITLLK